MSTSHNCFKLVSIFNIIVFFYYFLLFPRSAGVLEIFSLFTDAEVVKIQAGMTSFSLRSL